MVPIDLNNANTVELESLPIRLACAWTPHTEPLRRHCMAVLHAGIANVDYRSAGVSRETFGNPGRIGAVFFDLQVIVLPLMGQLEAKFLVDLKVGVFRSSLASEDWFAKGALPIRQLELRTYLAANASETRLMGNLVCRWQEPPGRKFPCIRSIPSRSARVPPPPHDRFSD